MNEDRKQILQMLAAGQITAEEAERLMAAIEQPTPVLSAAAAGPGAPGQKPKYLRIAVDTEAGHGGPT